jgi:beta-N-acetylhexosaminidase
MGELLMLRLREPHWSSSLERQLRALAPGAVLLAGALPRSPETLCELLAAISRCLPSPPILAIAEEGGDHDPLSALLPPFPSPQSIAQKGARGARQAGELIGETLKLLGFNANLAPVLDLAPTYRFPPDLNARPVYLDETLTSRAFSEDPRKVNECAWFWVEGHARHKIMSCAKHFPGLASVPPGLGTMPVCGLSMSELWAYDLVPYRELLPHLPMVLMSTAVYKAYDFDYPCSAALSDRVVEGLLRQKMRFRGVVIAPGLEDARVRGILDLGGAAVKAVNAGCDLILVDNEESWTAMRQGLEHAIESDKRLNEKFDRTRDRIQAARRRLAPPSGQLDKTAWDRLTRRFEEFSSGV